MIIYPALLYYIIILIMMMIIIIIKNSGGREFYENIGECIALKWHVYNEVYHL